MRCLLALLLALGATHLAPAAAAEIDWDKVAAAAADRLSAYIRIDSSNPPGDTVRTAAFLGTELRVAGIDSETFGAEARKPFLIGRMAGSGKLPKPLVLLNHMDVVPADAAHWTLPPFGGDFKDGMVYGRGALDMKGLTIAMTTALRVLAQSGQVPRHDIVFLAVPDEEVGGAQGSAWLAQHRPDVLDADAVWDEGGIGLTNLFAAPAVFISVTEKQVLWIKLIAEGPAGHGSRPFHDAAPRRLIEALDRVLATPPAPRLTPVARDVFRNVGMHIRGLEGFAMRRLGNPVVWLFADGLLQQEPWSAALTRDTIALTMLDAGYKPNVIPERAEAVLDCRLLPDTVPQAFIEQLKKRIADPGIRLEVLQEPETAPPSPTDTPLFGAMRRALGTVYPDVAVTPSMTIGGTDSRFFRARGVPAYGLFPVLLPKEITATIHGADERLPVTALGQAIRVVYETLRAM
jgi:acetylornithine deacetylase/succinyl-diaminopimelate desuccinylase-like protein